jgi:predicted  nucleic acid-binding Zn-ribbon protein
VTRFEDLLALQELDTRLDQLRHRRATLPELQARDDARRALADAEAQVEACDARLRSVRATQREAEDHAELLGDKIDQIQASLYDGSVVAHKELESLQAEQASLRERRATFEDEALAQMELAEPIEEELAALRAHAGELAAALASAEEALTVATAEVDAEIDREQLERDGAAAAVPADLLERYDALRAGLGGVAVARLSGARCDGCHLEIPSAQLEALRRAPEDEVVTCPECARILVR